MFSRRDFFKRSAIVLAGAAAAGVELDADRLLWIPGAKTIFLPTPEQTCVVLEAGLRGGKTTAQMEALKRYISHTGRYVVTVAAPLTGEHGPLQVRYDENWKAVHGHDYRERRDFTPEELATLTEKMATADPSTMPWHGPYVEDLNLPYRVQKLDRFVESIKSDHERSPIADGESRPGWFNEICYPGAPRRREG